EATSLCAQAARTLAQAMSKTTDPSALSSLARGLARVAARLGPPEAAPAARALTQAMSKTTDRNALWDLAKSPPRASARLEIHEAAKHYAQEAHTLFLLLPQSTIRRGLSQSANPVEQRLLSGLLSGDPRHPAACAAGLVATVQAAQYGQPLLAPIVHV